MNLLLVLWRFIWIKINCAIANEYDDNLVYCNNWPKFVSLDSINYIVYLVKRLKSIRSYFRLQTSEASDIRILFPRVFFKLQMHWTLFETAVSGAACSLLDFASKFASK